MLVAAIPLWLLVGFVAARRDLEECGEPISRMDGLIGLLLMLAGPLGLLSQQLLAGRPK